MKRIFIFLLLVIFIPMVLIIFAGLGFFMLFVTLWHTIFTAAIFRLDIAEWIIGKRFSEEQKLRILKYSSSKFSRAILVFIDLGYLAMTIFLFFHNVRIIELSIS